MLELRILKCLLLFLVLNKIYQNHYEDRRIIGSSLFSLLLLLLLLIYKILFRKFFSVPPVYKRKVSSVIIYLYFLFG